MDLETPGETRIEADATAAESTPATPSPEVVAQANGAAETQPVTPNPTPESEVAPVDWGKVDAGAYQQLRDAYLNGEEPQGEPASAPTEEPAAAAAAAAPQAAPTEQPAAAPEEGEGPFGERYRPRLGKLPKVQQETIQLVRELTEAGTSISFAEAEQRVKAKYGMGDTPAGTEPAAPGKTSAEITAHIAQLETELQEAGDLADTARQSSISRDLRKADRELLQALQAEDAAERAAVAAIDAEHTRARKAMHAAFPDFKNKTSPLSQKYLALLDELEAAGDPVMSLSETRRMQAVAKMAAAELGIKAVDPNAPAAAPVPQPPAQAPASTLPVNPPATRPPVLPVSGAHRTSAPANQSAQILQRIDSVKSPEDYRNLLTEMGVA